MNRQIKWLFVGIFLIAVQSLDACKNVQIVPHSKWTTRAAKPLPALKRPQKHVIIAHTVTPECKTLDDCSKRMRSMQNYHMDKLKKADIHYNFAIGGDGRVYEGTGWTKEGIHTAGWNSKSYGIAFIGDYRTVKPNNAMQKAARALIVCGIQKGYISASREIHGHRDATCTISPGDALYNIIKKWPNFKGGKLPGYKC